MDSGFMERALEQAPALVIAVCAIAWIVRVFLNHINEDREARDRLAREEREHREKVESERTVAIGATAQQCHDVQSRAIEMLGRTGNALDRNSHVLTKLEAHLIRQEEQPK